VIYLNKGTRSVIEQTSVPS